MYCWSILHWLLCSPSYLLYSSPNTYFKSWYPFPVSLGHWPVTSLLDHGQWQRCFISMKYFTTPCNIRVQHCLTMSALDVTMKCRVVSKCLWRVPEVRSTCAMLMLSFWWWYDDDEWEGERWESSMRKEGFDYVSHKRGRRGATMSATNEEGGGRLCQPQTMTMTTTNMTATDNDDQRHNLVKFVQWCR